MFNDVGSCLAHGRYACSACMAVERGAQDDRQLERRKVAALERIAAAFERLSPPEPPEFKAPIAPDTSEG